MSLPLGPETTAVVVTCGTTPYLRRTLEGLAAQTCTPTRIVLVDIWTSGRDLGTGHALQSLVTDIGLDTRCSVRVVQAPGARTFGDAVRQGLERNAEAQQRADKLHETRTGEIPAIRHDSSPGWLWLLHDDSAPAPEALERLVHTAESGPSIAVAGAKQRDWEHPELLLEVGIHATASARRFNPIDADEIDQGQYDSMADVLAVGLAGALVRRDVWNRLGGIDPALGPFGDGLEFCRRARLAGYRVVVEPEAIVYHARATYLGLRSYGHAQQSPAAPDPRRSFGARRRAQLYNWLIATPAWRIPLLLVWLLVLTPVRALARFVGKDLALARAELAAGAAVLSRPDLWLAARAKVRASATIPAAALAALQVDSREIARKKREQRRAAADARALRAVSELELAERAAVARRRRSAATAVALVTTAASIGGLHRLLGAGTLTGGALLPGDIGLRDLTQIATSWWIPAGDGIRGPADPFFTVMLLPMLTGVQLSTVTSLAVFLAVPAAALTAWFAAGAATRQIGLRFLASFLWAFAPVLVYATGQGRIAPALAHVALPVAGLLTARAMGLARRDVVSDRGAEAHPRDVAPTAGVSLGAAAGAGLAMVVVTAGAPVLLPVSVLVFLGLAAFCRRRVLWFIPLPALILFGPLLTEATRTWHVIFASPGVPLEFAPPEPWQLALGVPAALGVPGAALLPLIPGAAAACLALGAFLRGTARARAVRFGWLLALVGLAVAVAGTHVTVALDNTGAIVLGWPGPGISLSLFGLLLAMVTGGDGLREILARYSFGWRHLSTAALAVVGGVGAAAAIAFWFLGMLGPVPDLQLTSGVRPMTPAVSGQARDGDNRARTLALQSRDGVVTAELWRGNGPQLQHTSTIANARTVADPLAGEAAVLADPAADALAETVAAIVTGSATGAGELLAAHAIAVVLVPPSADVDAARTRLVSQLDATPGLARVTENESGAIWRVVTDASGPAAVARLTLADGGVVGLPADTLGARATVPDGAAGRAVILAERADADWHATWDGIALARVEQDWRQAFVLPAGSGELRITHAPPLRQPWLIAQAVVLGAVTLLAIPVRRRREEQ